MRKTHSVIDSVLDTIRRNHPMSADLYRMAYGPDGLPMSIPIDGDGNDDPTRPCLDWRGEPLPEGTQP